MAVTLFSVFIKQKKDLFRAYKKVDNKPYAEYFSDKADADARQAELDKLGENSADWKLKNIFIQREAADALSFTGSNIGIRHVYLRLAKTKANSDRLTPTVQFTAYNDQAPNGHITKNFPLSIYGWPNALYEAARCSFNNTIQEHESVTLDAVNEWVDSNESDVAAHLWRMIGNAKGTVLIDSDFHRGAAMMYMRLSETRRNTLVLATRLPHTGRSITITDYDSLFQNAAYFTALQITHREFSNDAAYSSYAFGIYFMLKGEWLTALHSQGIEYERYMGSAEYDFVKWKELVNQWCDREYGQALLS